MLKVISPVFLLTFAFSLSSLPAAIVFSPPGGQPGSSAIKADNPAFVGWASEVTELIRGPQNISNPTGPKTNVGTPDQVLGPAGGGSVLSLGDGGSITLAFATAITNGAGADFAVFENGFMNPNNLNQVFMELAFVEVSSDGVNFFRFPSISNTQTATQVGSFAYLNATDIYNLAGRDPSGWGTPFDLEEMVGISPLLNVNAVTHVRLIDVIGSIARDPINGHLLYATYDSLGNIINDPQTPFANGGFDLDAIGVINQVPEPSRVLLLMAGLVFGITHRRRKVTVLK